MNELQKLIEANPGLKAKVEALSKDPNATVADIIALAKEHGLEITEADFQAAPEGELSDDELEAVAGGAECYCAIGGGGTGTHSEHNETCACVALGFGTTDAGGLRCSCAAAGYGSKHV